MNGPKTGTPGHYANHVFRRRTLSNGAVRGSSNYHAAVDRLPRWLSERFPSLSHIVGAYENVPGSPSDALIFLEDRICLVSTDGDGLLKEVRYRDIAGWDWFSKDPIARALTVELVDGGKVELPIYGVEGAVASLATFVAGAAHRSRTPIRLNQ